MLANTSDPKKNQIPLRVNALALRGVKPCAVKKNWKIPCAVGCLYLCCLAVSCCFLLVRLWFLIGGAAATPPPQASRRGSRRGLTQKLRRAWLFCPPPSGGIGCLFGLGLLCGNLLVNEKNLIGRPPSARQVFFLQNWRAGG